MFNPTQLERIVDLHQKSYLLLKWANQSLRKGTLDFSHVHEAMSASQAAEEWIRRHLKNVPANIRPQDNEIGEFARLFASYLSTSFELIEEPGTKLVSPCGCYCSMCSYLVRANHLKTRKVTKKTQENARELKCVYLRTLANDLGLSAERIDCDNVLGDASLSSAVSLTTYAHELIRRSAFASQGQGILALWREIAWDKMGPKKKFVLKAKDVLQAEKRICERLKNVRDT